MKNISRNIQKSQQLYYKLNIERLLEQIYQAHFSFLCFLFPSSVFGGWMDTSSGRNAYSEKSIMMSENKLTLILR